jgi:hypothetical protein
MTELVLPLSMTEGMKSEKMSDRYAYIPTQDVVQTMLDNNYYISKIVATKPRSKDPRVVKHFVRMRNNDHPEGANGTHPEIVIVNAHDGTTSLQFMAGLFRMICSNGLVVGTHSFAPARIAHRANWREEALEKAHDVIYKASEAARRTELLRQKRLNTITALQFAQQASQHFYEGKISPHDLLTARRSQDVENDLWTIFNRVQENIIRGGLSADKGEGQRKFFTRSVRGAHADLTANNWLWNLTEEYLDA